MSVLSTNAPINFSGFGAAITAAFSKFMNTSSMARRAEARHEEFMALSAKTDAELAKMGLSRDTIAMHVFRDVLFI